MYRIFLVMRDFLWLHMQPLLGGEAGFLKPGEGGLGYLPTPVEMSERSKLLIPSAVDLVCNADLQM